MKQSELTEYVISILESVQGLVLSLAGLIGTSIWAGRLVKKILWARGVRERYQMLVREMERVYGEIAASARLIADEVRLGHAEPRHFKQLSEGIERLGKIIRELPVNVRDPPVRLERVKPEEYEVLKREPVAMEICTYLLDCLQEVCREMRRDIRQLRKLSF